MASSTTQTIIQVENIDPSSAATSARTENQPPSNGKPKGLPRKNYNEVHALPLPIHVFPFPTIYPNNPLSWLHLAYVWLGQALLPPPKEPSVVYQGIWDQVTRSVHIKNPDEAIGLWNSGFFGKGSLSRSEPNWQARELNRRGEAERTVSEQVTVSRREDRHRMKWERAKIELEAIEKSKLQELVPPVGPLELLALPNSVTDFHAATVYANGPKLDVANGAPIGNGHALRPSLDPLGEDNPLANLINGDDRINGSTNGHAPSCGSEDSSRVITPSKDSGIQSLKRPKSVRFSPRVESTTFQQSDPPSPQGPLKNTQSRPSQEPGDHLDNREHFQLSPVESFFLAFALGVLTVSNPSTGKHINNRELLQLLRCSSYFPPRNRGPDSLALRPDDPFLIQYAAYHHFRSLGWVVRDGIKFGADWLLYQRGVVFDHAEFAIRVLPSYKDPEWKHHDQSSSKISWSLLMGTNRALSHVMKTLVMVYIETPGPAAFQRALDDPKGGIAAAMRLYRVREFIVKRWSPNRNR
jgi:tRNA-splicing endonuclease subunit Sen2